MTIQRRAPDAPHVPLEHELRRAYEAAQHLVEALEVASLGAAYFEATQLRQRIFMELQALNERQVGDRH
jgi:hypothetical protein